MHKGLKYHALVIFLVTVIASWNSAGEAQNKTRQDLDLLSQQLSMQIESRQFRESLDTIASIKSSGHDFEAEIFYFQGISYLNIKQYSNAEAALRVYIELSGSEGQYFQEALETIDQIDIRLEGSQNSDGSRSYENAIELKNDNAIVVDDLESKICEGLRIWHTTRQPGKVQKIGNQYECGSHYVLEQDGQRKIIWRTKERD